MSLARAADRARSTVRCWLTLRWRRYVVDTSLLTLRFWRDVVDATRFKVRCSPSVVDAALLTLR
eukprot:3997800-Pyramimonas_sp.AAC.1